jgi:16S rRNA (cytosine1402-N4)-methyltransferase
MKKFIGFDVDPLAHQLARPRLEACSSEGTSIHLLRKNFREMTSALQELSPGLEAGGVDAMLIDFGVSSMQLDTAERGFSFLADGPVDMRMDPTASLRAEQIVNMWPASEIGRILRDYGEEVHWKGIAQRIVERRPIHTTSELVRAIGGKRGGNKKKKQIHPATRTFQAIRIAVNDELGAIEQVCHELILYFGLYSGPCVPHFKTFTRISDHKDPMIINLVNASTDKWSRLLNLFEML